jgi:hypothetical protein
MLEMAGAIVLAGVILAALYGVFWLICLIGVALLEK